MMYRRLHTRARRPAVDTARARGPPGGRAAGRVPHAACIILGILIHTIYIYNRVIYDIIHEHDTPTRWIDRMDGCDGWDGWDGWIDAMDRCDGTGRRDRSIRRRASVQIAVGLARSMVSSSSSYSSVSSLARWHRGGRRSRTTRGRRRANDIVVGIPSSSRATAGTSDDSKDGGGDESDDTSDDDVVSSMMSSSRESIER